jgi:hypothetical protein
MGQSVLYCRKCGAKLTPEMFNGDEAVFVDDRPYCVGCVDTPVPAMKRAPPPPRPAPTPRRIPAIPAADHPRPHTSRRSVPVRSGKGALIGIVAAVLAAAGAAAWFFMGGSAEPPPVAKPRRPVPVTPAPETPKEEPPVAKPPEAAVPSAPAAFEEELNALETKRVEACAREEYGPAIAALEEARPRRADVPWVQAIEAKLLMVRADAARTLGPVKEKAAEARRRGATDEVRAAVDRVSKWGLKEASAELDKALEEVAGWEKSAPAPAPAPAPVPEAPLYARRWEAAMALAADRDYSGAIQALEEASQKLEDKKLQGDAAGDMEILRVVRGLLQETHQVFSKSAKGQKLAVRVFGEDGKAKPVEGAVLRSGPGWVELKGEKETSIVDFGDLTGLTVAELFRSRPEKKDGDARMAALFLLLEGEPEAAREIMGEGVPDPFWNHARRRSAIRPGMGLSESDARTAFHEIIDPQRDWPEGQRRGGTAARARALLEKYGRTFFVRRHGDALARLMEPAKEYLFTASDLKESGTFRTAVFPKVGNAWAVSQTVTGAAAKDNFVELEFDASPDAAWRGWAYAGVCCAEVAGFYLQATDLKGPAKGGAPVEMEPGANASLPLKFPSMGLPTTHAAHPATAEATKWGWVPIPLPKYSASGPRKVRVLADMQGAAVAWVVISSTKTAPPPESRMLEIEKAPAAGAARPERKPAAVDVASGLVARWSFDEGDGVSGADAEGRGFAGGLRNGVTWGPGRAGTALVFDGADDFFEVPDIPELDPAQITLAAWFCPGELRSSGKTRDWLVSRGQNEQNNGHYALALDTREKQPIAYLNIGGGRDGCAEVRGPAGSIAVGGWYHLAMTYDGATLKLYFNGAPAGMKAVNKPRKPAPGLLVMGKRGDDWSKYKGRVDEVWLYNRALAAAEIQAMIRASIAARPK